MVAPALTNLGKALEKARLDTEPPLTRKEAAKLAGISENYWRDVITGEKTVRRGQVRKITPKATTVVSMCKAVGVPTRRGLALAGYEAEAELWQEDVARPETLAEIVASVEDGEFTQGDAEAILAVIRERRLMRHPELAEPGVATRGDDAGHEPTFDDDVDTTLGTAVAHDDGEMTA